MESRRLNRSSGLTTILVMFRLLVRATVLIMFLGIPTLCLAGVLEHLCSEGPETTSCNHEEACDQDPCSDIALRPDVNPREWTLGMDPSHAALEQSPAPHLADLAATASSTFPPGLATFRSSFSARLPLRI